ncbi:MAG TPA: LysM peptidoglycan-binding domain-containing protein [Solirubrobacterales bacterium]|nr:LysM peptidoglycan-binding domain-containing protein [Solirubrobacterales bacterium]
MRKTLAVAATAVVSTALAAPATAAVSHTIQPGETLSGIAAANGLSTDTLAAWNGVSSDYLLIAGNTLSVPSLAETGVTTTATSTTATDPATTTSTSTAPAPWLGSIPSPWGDLYLDAGAAAAWNAMRQASLSTYGVDLYPAGPLSAYRTSTQQGEMYELYLSGVGSPANPPGMSSHELGVSVDLATPQMRDIVDQIGWQYGWTKSEAPTEWWHVTWTG